MRNTLNNIYISGPMTGIAEYNYPAFFELEEHLVTKAGFIRDEIRNPARIDDGESDKFTKTREYYIRKSIELILQCGYCTLLPGWEKSAGARLEVNIAQELGLTFLSNPWCIGPYADPDEGLDIMKEAASLVDGARQEQYGHPVDHFTDVGRIWGSILRIDDVPPQKVGLMMVGVKMAREAFKHKPDNLVDMIGYVKTIDIVKKKLDTTTIPC